MYVLLLVFIISWLYVIGETYVNFNRRDNIVYLSKKESAHIFANDPEIVSYIACQRKVEKTIKGFSNHISENIEIYGNNFKDFTPAEESHINMLLNKIVPKLKKIYPRFDSSNWNFIKSNNKIEGGMPFTISDYIILPENVIHKSIQAYNYSGINSSIETLGDILVHEKMHIYQRRNQQMVDDFYYHEWHFTPVNNLNIPNYINDKIRTNPDGPAVNYIFKEKYLTLSLLKNNHSLSKIDILHYPVYHQNNIYYLDKSVNYVKDYHNFFCNISFPYHPNEIAAYLFGDIVISQITNRKINTNCQAMVSFNIWLKDTFG